MERDGQCPAGRLELRVKSSGSRRLGEGKIITCTDSLI
jgi:hypothetical protein